MSLIYQPMLEKSGVSKEPRTFGHPVDRGVFEWFDLNIAAGLRVRQQQDCPDMHRLLRQRARVRRAPRPPPLHRRQERLQPPGDGAGLDGRGGVPAASVAAAPRPRQLGGHRQGMQGQAGSTFSFTRTLSTGLFIRSGQSFC